MATGPGRGRRLLDPDSNLEDDDGQQGGGCLEDQGQGRNKILSFYTISPISSAYMMSQLSGSGGSSIDEEGEGEGDGDGEGEGEGHGEDDDGAPVCKRKKRSPVWEDCAVKEPGWSKM